MVQGTPSSQALGGPQMQLPVPPRSRTRPLGHGCHWQSPVVAENAEPLGQAIEMGETPLQMVPQSQMRLQTPPEGAAV